VGRETCLVVQEVQAIELSAAGGVEIIYARGTMRLNSLPDSHTAVAIHEGSGKVAVPLNPARAN
jgi:hypothetical protein